MVQRNTESIAPGTYLVDTLPILKYVPAWVPGARRFQTAAAVGRAQSLQMVDQPYERVKNEMVWLFKL